MTNATLADEVLKRDALGRVRTPRVRREAVVEGGRCESWEPAGALGLQIELPGGSRMSVASPMQLPMAAALVALIAQRTCARC